MSRNLDIESFQFRDRIKKGSEKKEKKAAKKDSIHYCPKCNSKLQEVHIGSQTVLQCVSCHGIWLRNGQLEAICKITNINDYLDKLYPQKSKKQKISNFDTLFHFDSNTNKCPDCSYKLIEVYFRLDSKLWIDTCRNCKGIFYDSNKLSTVIKLIKDNIDT